MRDGMQKSMVVRHMPGDARRQADGTSTDSITRENVN
jgi:hypothetical protein